MFSQVLSPARSYLVRKERLAEFSSVKISESTVRRLSLYLRLLRDADAAGQRSISSDE